MKKQRISEKKESSVEVIIEDYRSRNWLQPFCTSPKVVCSELETYKTSDFVSLGLVLLQLLVWVFHSPKNPLKIKSKPCKNLILWKKTGTKIDDDFTVLLVFLGGL